MATNHAIVNDRTVGVHGACAGMPGYYYTSAGVRPAESLRVIAADDPRARAFDDDRARSAQTMMSARD